MQAAAQAGLTVNTKHIRNKVYVDMFDNSERTFLGYPLEIWHPIFYTTHI